MKRMEMPLAVSYRGFDPARSKLDKGPFEGAWFTLLANLLGLPRSEVEQREKQRQAGVRRAWIGGLASVSTALLALSIWALRERDNALHQRDEALRSQSLFLAQMSQQQNTAGQHDIAIKLALQALPRRLDRPDRPWVQAAESALLAAFAGQTFRFEIGGPRTGRGSTLQRARISSDGLRAVLDYGTQAELWSLARIIRAFQRESTTAAPEVCY
jgi:hypothetical protein